MSGSMTDMAHQILSRSPQAVPFLPLYQEVSDSLGFSKAQYEKNIAHFFSDLSLDTRFVSRPNNNWDLKQRHATKDIRINIDDLILDDEEEEEEAALEASEENIDEALKEAGMDEEVEEEEIELDEPAEDLDELSYEDEYNTD